MRWSTRAEPRHHLNGSSHTHPVTREPTGPARARRQEEPGNEGPRRRMTSHHTSLGGTSERPALGSIHGHGGTCHPTGPLGAEEDDHLGHLLGRAEAAPGELLAHHLLHLLGVLLA